MDTFRLKKYQNDNLDKLYPLSLEATEYLSKHYEYPLDSMAIARLGVECPGIKTQPSDKLSFHILSCAYISPVKRLTRLVDAMKCVLETTDRTIRWTHLGGGEGFDKLYLMASSLERDFMNFSFEITGPVKNADVLAFYTQNKVDLFVNVSESEGQPVSIMEAMSFAVPIIATDVGGVKEMFMDGKSGILLDADATPSLIAKAIAQYDFFQSNDVRKSVFRDYQNKFDAGNNYPVFIENVLQLKE